MGTPAHHAGPSLAGFSRRYHSLSRRGRIVTWTAAVFAVLVIIGAAVGNNPKTATSNPPKQQQKAQTPAKPAVAPITLTATVNETVTTRTYTLTGTVSAGAIVTVNGAAATVTGGSWSKTVSLHVGTNTFTVQATKSGTATKSQTATIIRTLPSLNLRAPKNATVAGEAYTLTGTATPTAHVTVNGQPAVQQGSQWSAAVTLHHGANGFTIKVAQPGHETATAHVTIIRRWTADERAAQRAAAEQAYKNSATTIPYNQLMKDADSYAGKVVTYHGQIFQIQEDSAAGVGIMLVSVTDEGYGLWDDNIWVNFRAGQVRGAEGDMVTFWGVVEGSRSYETQIGGETYVPEVTAKYIDG